MRRSVLVVGDADAAEFAPAVSALRELADCHFAGSLRDLGQFPAESPAWIVLLQGRSGQFSTRETAAVRRRFPLAQWGAITGFWTAGELRTGQPLSGVQTIPWETAAARLTAIFSAAADLAPITASPEEAIVRDLEKLDALSGLAVIAADRQSDFQYWADAVRGLGMSAVWRTPGGRVHAAAIAAAIYLPSDWGPNQADQAARFLADHPAESRILSVGLPRWEDRQLAEQVGFTAILGRPFRLRDLQLAISAAPTAGNTAS
ncbi:hypothetical protein [Blastopirellula marina]|uniref:Uncharacterized protein n=1 Tax=Blastopirellula marina TaxID=124 RepID=A0A2S8GIT2_9BACT|nr:hypothetical protein [Blastopirellula marina]PQO44338.1 hypothetical protein C5Y93_20470 [Blastopirellula marina]